MHLTGPHAASNVLDMTINDEFKELLTKAADNVTEAKRAYDVARQVREALIRDAAEAGGTYREIAALSGVAYQRVGQIITGETPPGLQWDAPKEIACKECGAKPGEFCEGKYGASFHDVRIDERMAMFKAEHPELG